MGKLIMWNVITLDGYFEGLKKNKITVDPNYVVQTDLSWSSTSDAMKSLLSLKTRPKAVIAFNDYVALDAIKYTRNQGVKINKDMFFVSYANLPITSYLDHPPIASVEQFPHEQAEKATALLLQLINGKEGDDDDDEGERDAWAQCLQSWCTLLEVFYSLFSFSLPPLPFVPFLLFPSRPSFSSFFFFFLSLSLFFLLLFLSLVLFFLVLLSLLSLIHRSTFCPSLNLSSPAPSTSSSLASLSLNLLF